MKKSILAAIFLSILLGLTACGQPTPEKALDNYLKEIKSTGVMPEAQADDLDLSALAAKLEYDITGSTVTDDTAEVYVTITTPDLSDVMQELIVQAFSSVFSGGNDTDSDTMVQKVIDEKLASPDTAVITRSVTAYMTKTDDAWVLAEEGNEAFLSALVGGLVSESLLSIGK